MYRVRRGSGEHSELDPDHYTSFLCVTQWSMYVASLNRDPAQNKVYK